MKREIRSNWDHAVLVCAKCSKRVGGGFGPGGKQPLAKALRKHLKVRKGRKSDAGIVEVRCLGVCPKNAVVAVNAAHARMWNLIEPGADLDDVAATLGLARQPV